MHRCHYFILMLVAVLVNTMLVTCGKAIEDDAPVIYQIAPNEGPGDAPTEVIISGEGFEPQVYRDLSSCGLNKGLYIDDSFEITVGTMDLDGVSWVDSSTLEGTVPAGMAPGLYQLTIVLPNGDSVQLVDAYRVRGQTTVDTETSVSSDTNTETDTNDDADTDTYDDADTDTQRPDCPRNSGWPCTCDRPGGYCDDGSWCTTVNGFDPPNPKRRGFCSKMCECSNFDKPCADVGFGAEAICFLTDDHFSECSCALLHCTADDDCPLGQSCKDLYVYYGQLAGTWVKMCGPASI